MFDELPTELVERILALLSYEEKVAVLGVCKRWRTILQRETGPPQLVVSVEENEEFVADLRWNPHCDHDYLVGQYVLLPRRLGGHPVYQQAETVGKENYFLFRDSSMWQFSHILGASDGRYPRIDQNPGLPPKEWRNKKTLLKVLVPAELNPCQKVVIEANTKAVEMEKMPRCFGTFQLMKGVWSCGKPVYKGPNNFILMVTGKRWGVKRKLDSWGEVLLRANEASLGPAGGGPWSVWLGNNTWEECDISVTENE